MGMRRQASYCTPLRRDLNLADAVVHDLSDQVHVAKLLWSSSRPGDATET